MLSQAHVDINAVSDESPLETSALGATGTRPLEQGSRRSARPLGDRVLMGPGPSNPYPEVAEAFARPLLGHLDPEFIALLDDTNERLRQVFRTNNQLTFPLSGTGSAGMEAAFVNFVSPGDIVVVGVNGLFGERMCDAAARCGATIVRVEAEWGKPLDPEAVLGAHSNPKMIAVVHAETSTGVRNDVDCIGAAKGDSLFVVDCVTSLAGSAIEIDGWHADIAFSATQKCLGVPPGLAPFTASAKAIDRLLAKPQSWYFDLKMISKYVSGESISGKSISGTGARVYHHTAPISMVFALHAALGAVLDEGVEATWNRHRECGQALQDGLESLGFELFAEKSHRLSQLTSVWVPLDRLPHNVDEAAARRLLLDRYGIEIGGGLGAFAGKMWRIGCMGHTARMRNVVLLLAALDEMFAK